ncbi:hypothetical protein ACFPMF_27855 [Larkinella bovis]|uniref:Uncharacterized protein n=1 Tax=Larkinella bovis TaxID=683041 RepID=A0ABW0IK07_9BACT
MLLTTLLSLLSFPSFSQFGKKASNRDVKDTLLLQERSPSFKPKMGRLVDSISIEAVDKSFVIAKGETFKMDKLGIEQRAGWVNPSSNFSKVFNKSDGIPVKIIVSRKIPEYEETIVKEKNVLTGKEVDKPVKKLKGYKGRDDIFYGLLEFNKVHEICNNDPATRAYFISIPPKYLDAARGGNISVVYEYYNCTPVRKKGANNYTTWVLWISDIEFTK